jgi:hypothetical protein
MIAASTFFHAETFSTLLGQEGNGSVFGSMASIGVSCLLVFYWRPSLKEKIILGVERNRCDL